MDMRFRVKPQLVTAAFWFLVGLGLLLWFVSFKRPSAAAASDRSIARGTRSASAPAAGPYLYYLPLIRNAFAPPKFTAYD
jgi:hypothetical protein